MDNILSRNDLREDDKAKQFLQRQNRYLAFKKQLHTKTLLPEPIQPEEMNTSHTEDNSPTSIRDSSKVTTLSTPLNPFSVTPNLNQAAILPEPKVISATLPPLNPAILTPPLTVEIPSPMPAAPKRKQRRINFVNYLGDDDDYRKQRRQTRRHRYRVEPYKYSKDEDDD